MEDNVGVDDSEFDSVTSSQESLMEDNVGVDDSEFDSVTSSQESLMEEDDVGVDDSEFDSVTSSQKSIMEDSDGVGDSEFGSVTSSQKSLLNHVALADSQGLPTKSTGGVLEMDTDSTEVIGNLVTQPIVPTPVLSFTTPTSLDSVNDEIFRTPPEVASLSTAADSETKVISDMKSASIEGMKSPTPTSIEAMKSPTHAHASPSLVVKNGRATETLAPVSEVAPLSSTPSIPTKNVRVPAKLSGSASIEGVKSPTPDYASPSLVVENVRATETLEPASDMALLSSTSSLPAKNVRVPVKLPGSTSSSKAIGRSKGITKKRTSTSVVITGLPKSLSLAGNNDAVSKLVPPSSKTAKTVRVPVKIPESSTGEIPGIKISETAQPGADVARIPFREIIKAILRNSGQLNENEDHGNLSCVDTLKKMGVRFP